MKRWFCFGLLVLVVSLCFAEWESDGYIIDGSLFRHWRAKYTFSAFEECTEDFIFSIPASTVSRRIPSKDLEGITAFVEEMKIRQDFEIGEIWNYIYIKSPTAYAIWFYRDSEQGLIVRVIQR
jgi:hypothetical protein